MPLQTQYNLTCNRCGDTVTTVGEDYGDDNGWCQVRMEAVTCYQVSEYVFCPKCVREIRAVLRETHVGRRDRRPHSRACGFAAHEHGAACHSNCPTCYGVEL